MDAVVAAALSPTTPFRSVTDSNVNSSCVYESPDGNALYVSTVLPHVMAWSGPGRCSWTSRRRGSTACST